MGALQGEHHHHRGVVGDDLLHRAGGGFYNSFLALTQMPQELSMWVVSQG
jgi:hypothetical protein